MTRWMWLALVLTALYAGTASAENTSGVPLPPAPDLEHDDPAIKGQRIAEHLSRFDSGWVDEVWVGRMTLFDGEGSSVERSLTWLVLEKPEGDKSIVRFRSPSDLKGVAALIHEHFDRNDEHWVYKPSERRTRRVAGSNQAASFQGSEFTYEDLGRRLEPAKYGWTFLGEETLVGGDGQEVRCLRVEAVPTYENTGYSRLVAWVNPELWRYERVEYFDLAGEALKVKNYGGFEHVHGRFWRPRSIEMQNLLTGKRTVLELDRLYVNLSLYRSSRTGEPRTNLTDDQFTERALSGR